MNYKGDNKSQVEVFDIVYGKVDQARKILQSPVRMFYERRLLEIGIANRNTANAICLDLGCGRGLFTSILASKFRKIAACDLSMQAVFTSSTILKLDNIDFLAADSVHLPFKSDSFDFIVIKDIIHHWMQSAEAMWEVQRILGPRGCLLSIEPNNRNFVTQISACLLPHERKVANHSPSFLIKFITGFGFQLDSADFYGFYVPYGPFYRVPKFLLPFLDLFEEVLKKMFPTYGGHFIASYKKIEPA